ncbi:hypothetical protein CEXT_63961 [Caerostris extrusa]|uniref:Transmembrane protein n=1 Tax=Caerostris extrusa TaxID=172846 RepID=A0AAV4TWL9_CAEEX|nr:hypothetical protein CEXT_63961 [Caerostris extrusa]
MFPIEGEIKKKFSFFASNEHVSSNRRKKIDIPMRFLLSKSFHSIPSLSVWAKTSIGLSSGIIFAFCNIPLILFTTTPAFGVFFFSFLPPLPFTEGLNIISKFIQRRKFILLGHHFGQKFDVMPPLSSKKHTPSSAPIAKLFLPPPLF